MGQPGGVFGFFRELHLTFRFRAARIDAVKCTLMWAAGPGVSCITGICLDLGYAPHGVFLCFLILPGVPGSF